MVRLPWLLDATVRLTFRLPDSHRRTALLRYSTVRGWAALNRRDWEFNTLVFDDRYTFHNADPTRSLTGVPDQIDGVGEFIERMDAMFGEWETLTIELDGDPIDLGGGRVLGFQRVHGVGKGSGVALDEATANVIEFERGRLVRQTWYWDRQTALREFRIRAPGEA